MKKWIAALLLFAFTVCPCLAETAEAFDAGADELLNGVVARAQNIHNAQIGYPVNEDVRLTTLIDTILKIKSIYLRVSFPLWLSGRRGVQIFDSTVRVRPKGQDWEPNGFQPCFGQRCFGITPPSLRVARTKKPFRIYMFYLENSKRNNPQS